MNMRLMSLKIQNFMGCKSLSIQFDGENMKIFGDNGTGKTTIQHAFNWLLFDKNAVGKTDFNIKPLDIEGNVIHRLETSVEALFDIDGKPMQFKKVLLEKWTRRRGSVEETYSGNENNYYVNTIPKKKKEFTEEIAKIIDENVFRMVTNPMYFNENIKWQDRRKMLLDICGDIKDLDVIFAHEVLAPLALMLDGYTVEELKSMVSSELRSINKELGIIPSRIAEAELAKPTTGDMDISQLEELEAQFKAKRQEKSDILNGAEVVRLKAKLDNLKIELNRKKTEPWVPHVLPEYKEQADIQRFIKDADESIKLIEDNTIPQIELQIRLNGEKKKRLSDDWDAVFKEAFVGSVCPTCNQELPPEQVDEKKKEFNVRKASKLDSIEAELTAIKKRDTDLLFKKSEAQNAITGLKEKKAKLFDRMDVLSDLLFALQQQFEQDKADSIASLQEQMSDMIEGIATLESKAHESVKSIDEEIQAIESKITPIKEYLAQIAIVKRQEERIEALKQEQVALSQRYTERERTLFLCEEFTRRKVAMINEKVNTLFKYTRFKLFDIQENGGIAETCEATFNGVPYADLNTAGKINTGLDIINTLSTKYGVSAPMFVDNMESVTKPIDTLAQRIELIVSEGDKTLRFEKED